MGTTVTETFQLIKQAYGDNALIHRFLNGMQDFWTVVKILMMNAVDNQQPSEHLT
jgi:hypothetical protein